jgi:hypothetical protein
MLDVSTVVAGSACGSRVEADVGLRRCSRTSGAPGQGAAASWTPRRLAARPQMTVTV